MKIESVLSIPLSLVSRSGHVYHIDVRLMVMEDLGEEAIIGLPVIVKHLLPLFVEALKHTAELLMMDRQQNDVNECCVMVLYTNTYTAVRGISHI